MNQELSKLFYEIADIYEIKNVEWKPRAFRNAARALESLSENVAEIYKKGGIKSLMDIPGVGPAIAKHIEEFLKSGKIKEHQQLIKSLPAGIYELMDIEGLGPKKVMFLYKKLNIRSLDDLKKAIENHKLRNLPGFGEKTEDNLAKGLQIYEHSKERMLLAEALPIALDVVDKLKSTKLVKKISIAGSLRRMKETIGDVDILVCSSNPEKLMDFFTKMKDVEHVLSKGLTKSSVILKSGIQTDVRVVDSSSFGSAMQYFTGSKEHNIKLREIAIRKGYKLSEYGLFLKKSNKKIAGETEEGVYKKLGMSYVEPEMRENNGEIDLASKKKLPKLVELKDIQGDLHTHTNATDGMNTIAEMAKAAKALGQKYLCIADHTKSTAIAGGLKEDEMLAHLKEIRKLDGKFGIKLLTGAEVDILKDGSLDYPDELLKKMDVVTASVHSGFKNSREQMTKRICKALENENVDILGHMTGRLLNQRNPYELDVDAVLKKAAERKVCIEINAQPSRLDANDSIIRRGKELGIKFAINTDAHHTSQLRFMFYGVAMARRGWLENGDVINTRNVNELLRYFK